MNLKYISYFLLGIFLFFLPNSILAKNDISERDTTTENDSTSTKIRISKDAIESKVNYSAKDSIVFYANGKAYLYGEAAVLYQQLELTSAQITINTDSNMVHALSGKDSTGAEIGRPIFKDGGESYESKQIDFNFKTKKGLIRDVVTEQGEGYVTSGKAKKLEDNTFLMENGKYTTCNDHEHPHFYLNLTKAKVKPKEYIVAGPAYLVLADVPLPLALPFGFFPFTESYSSGILMPTFGEETQRGLYLRNGGYYFAINQYFDLALRGDIYTKGSWAVNATSRYRKKYKFSGNFYVGYQSTASGEKNLPDFQRTNDLKITWTHSQDAKANPFSTFSASINFTSTSYNKNNISSHYNPSSYGENNKSSSINYTYRFPESPFSITTNLTLNQRQSDSTLSLKFPTIHLNMSRVYPFKRKNGVGKAKWYEKIHINYSLNVDNYISTKQDKLFEANLLNDWNNGVKNQVNIGASYSIFKYIIFTPSLSYNEKWYFRKTIRQWDPIEQEERKYHENGFYRINDMNASASLSTQLYGFFQPVIGKKVSMIRHVFQPAVGLSFHPKMDTPFPSFNQDYYGEYLKKMADGSIDTVKYCYYQGNYYGVPTSNGSGLINLSVSNNIEMKVRSDKDSTGYKKISLIDNLTLSTSYNLLAEEEEAPWSDISANLRLKFFNKINLNISASFCPYTYQLNDNGSPYKSNISEWERNGVIARLTSARTSFNYSFNNNTFKKKKSEKEKEEEEEYLMILESNNLDNAVEIEDWETDKWLNEEKKETKSKENEESEFDKDGYLKFNMPWNLNISYSIAYSNYKFNFEKLEYERRLSQTFNFTGSVNFSENWRFSISSGVDFLNHKMSYTSCSVTRKLHCWSASLSFIPFGVNQGFNFRIGVNSSMLQDLKYEKTTSSGDYPAWY